MTSTLLRGGEVEVFNSRVVPLGSWWPATVMSMHGETSRIRYYNAPPDMGNAVFERISVNFLRPCPPKFPLPFQLSPGYTVEVFDVGSWKPAKILEGVDHSNIHVQLVGSLDRFTIHKCDVRVRCFLKDNQWMMIASDFTDSEYVHYDYPLCSGDRHSGENQEEAEEVPTRRYLKCVEFGEWRTENADAEFAADVCSFNGSRSCGSSPNLAVGQSLEINCGSNNPSGYGGSMNRLNAYRYIVAGIQAAAHGSTITWQQEIMMTEIRGLLGISNHEHMSIIRNIVPTS